MEVRNMKATQGFLSEDGTFFESKAECELYEAELLLDAVCDSHGVDPTAYKQMVRSSSQQTMRYIDAHHTYEEEVTSSGSQEREYATSVSAPGDSGSEDIAARLLELSPSSGEHMPTMGRGERTEGVSTEGEGVRVGGGTLDASTVRGGEDLATDTPPEAKRTRRRDRPQGVGE